MPLQKPPISLAEFKKKRKKIRDVNKEITSQMTRLDRFALCITDRVGTIGFSAGAELEGDAFFNGVVPGDPAATDPLDHFSTRPNFIALIYGGRTPRDPASCPPVFMFNTIEDSGHLTPEVNAWNALRAANIPTEVHFYNYGEHGTSMSPGDPLLGEWPELMISWLKASGFISEKKSAEVESK